MSCDRKNLLKLCVVILTAMVLAGPSDALAQRQKSPGGVTGGARLRPGTWSNQRASRHVRHARDYSRDIYRYSRDAGQIEPAVAKAESEALGRNIAKAQQELVTVRQQAGDHRETINALKSIEEHLSKVAERHKRLHEECCKESMDGTVSMKCCSDITLHLDRAMAEHAALLRLLEIGDAISQKEAPAVHEHK